MTIGLTTSLPTAAVYQAVSLDLYCSMTTNTNNKVVLFIHIRIRQLGGHQPTAPQSALTQSPCAVPLDVPPAVYRRTKHTRLVKTGGTVQLPSWSAATRPGQRIRPGSVGWMSPETGALAEPGCLRQLFFFCSCRTRTLQQGIPGRGCIVMF